MKESMSMGSGPCDEDLAQTVDPDYWDKSRNECNRFRTQLTTMFGPLAAELGVEFRLSLYTEHDEYREVVFRYDPMDAASLGMAIFMECHCPVKWADDHAYTRAEFEAWLTERNEGGAS